MMAACEIRRSGFSVRCVLTLGHSEHSHWGTLEYSHWDLHAVRRALVATCTFQPAGSPDHSL